MASGAACTSLTDEPSHVLRALGRPAGLARSSVRFSVGRPTTSAEIDRAAAIFAKTVVALRARSPGSAPPGDPALAPPGIVLIRGEAGSAEAGTWVLFTGEVRDGLLQRLETRVQGCPHSLLACERAVALLAGRPVAELGSLDPLEPGISQGIPSEKAGRLLIIQDALRNCLADWDNRGLRSTL